MLKRNSILFLLFLSFIAVTLEPCLAASCKAEKSAVKTATRNFNRAFKAESKQLSKIDRMAARVDRQLDKVQRTVAKADYSIARIINSCDSKIFKAEIKRLNYLDYAASLMATCFWSSNPPRCYLKAERYFAKAFKQEQKIASTQVSCNNKIASRQVKYDSKIYYEILKLERYEDDFYQLLSELPTLEASRQQKENIFANKEADLVECLAE